MSKLNEANEKIANGAVGAYKKVEGKFVDTFLTHEGETAEDAKKRLAEEAAAREKAAKEAAEKRAAANPVGVSDIGKASVEASRELGRASVEASKNVGKH